MAKNSRNGSNYCLQLDIWHLFLYLFLDVAGPMCLSGNGLPMSNDIEVLKTLLLGMPFEELKAFPHSSTFSYLNGGKKITATIWHDDITPDEIQLHLQVPSRHFGFLGIGHDCAMRVCRDGTWRYLTTEEWVDLTD